MTGSRAKRREYYLAAAEFWLKAMHRQRDRCLSQQDGDDLHADMDFYVVTVKRLREVARMARDRIPGSESVRKAIERFDERWPKLILARNYAEHVLGPGGMTPGGAWYFSNSIIGTRPDGGVNYLVDTRDTTRDAESLYEALVGFLGGDRDER